MVHVVDFFYADHCPGCPEARQVIHRFAASRRDVIVVEHDLEIEAQLALARRYRVIATPAVVIDGHAVMYGVPHPAALAARVDASRWFDEAR